VGKGTPTYAKRVPQSDNGDGTKLKTRTFQGQQITASATTTRSFRDPSGPRAKFGWCGPCGLGINRVRRLNAGTTPIGAKFSIDGIWSQSIMFNIHDFEATLNRAAPTG
jgi:hypothetical protein